MSEWHLLSGNGQEGALLQGPLSPIASYHGHLDIALHSEVENIFLKNVSVCIAVSFRFLHVLLAYIQGQNVSVVRVADVGNPSGSPSNG